MFVNAIEIVEGFTKPIHTITRPYGGVISSGTSILFFVNENGVAVTCKHVLNQIIQARQMKLIDRIRISRQKGTNYFGAENSKITFACFKLSIYLRRIELFQ